MYQISKMKRNKIAALLLLFSALMLMVNALPAYAFYFFLAAGVVATILLLLILFDQQISMQWRLMILLSLATVPVVAYALVRL